MIRIGLIGTGFMGSMHASCYEVLQASRDIQLTAVADLDVDKADRIALRFGAQRYSTGMNLIENANVDMVDICLPTYMHAEHALRAMQRGHHLIVEKPVCRTEQEAVQLHEMKKKTGVHFAVGHSTRFLNEYVYLKQLVDEEVFGKVLHADFRRISPRPTWGWEQWLLDSQKSGLAALDLHIHDVDFIRYLFGEPDQIQGAIPRFNQGAEHINAIYRFGHSVVNVEGSWGYPASFPFEMSFRVRFESATVVFSSLKTPSMIIYSEDGLMTVPLIKVEEPVHNGIGGGNISSIGSYLGELRYFIQCLENDCDPEIISLREGIDSFRLALREIELSQ